jgi:pyridoxamine 5'-phosphate oxidase family protein
MAGTLVVPAQSDDDGGMRFTDAQLAYLRSQLLGRLATVDPAGAPQNNPVGFRIDDEHRILVGGARMGATRKFHNVQRNPRVAFVVDDLASTKPWRPRMVEIRGTAEALTDVEPFGPGYSPEIIRITPERVFAFGLD